MRKTMTKEVTKTTVKIAKMQMEDGLPTAIQLPEEVLIGNVSLEKAQKLMNKKHGEQVTVFEVNPNTEVYEMPVSQFIELATVRQPEETEAETQN